MEGWIKIYRKILEWEWYGDTNVKVVFLHLLFTANHTDKNWRGQIIKRGQLITSVGNLAKQLHLTVQQVRTALEKLKSTNEITIKTTNQHTLITVEKYDEYQTSENINNKQITNEQQTNNSKNNKQITSKITNNSTNEITNKKNCENQEREEKPNTEVNKTTNEITSKITNEILEIQQTNNKQNNNNIRNKELKNKRNIIYTPSEDESSSGDIAKASKKHKYGEYKNVLLKDEELQALQRDFTNWTELITFLDEYIEYKGYKAKSHYLAIRKWVVDAVKSEKRKANKSITNTQVNNLYQSNDSQYQDLDRFYTN